MSGPALYRYFASRDELLTTLVTESYEDWRKRSKRRLPPCATSRLRTVRAPR